MIDHARTSAMYCPAPLSSDFASLRCLAAMIPEDAYRDRALVILARIERRARPLGVRFDEELDYPRRDW
jgi:hypothetical protein